MGRTTRYFERTAHNISGLTDNIDGVTGNFKRMMTINRAMSDNFAHMQAIPASRRPCKSDGAGVIGVQSRALQPYSPLPYKPVGQQRRREPPTDTLIHITAFPQQGKPVNQSSKCTHRCPNIAVYISIPTDKQG